MKYPSTPNRLHSTSRLLLGFLGMLLSGCVLLVGLGIISKAFAARIGSPQVVPSNSSALPFKSDVASIAGPAHLDERGNRPRSLSYDPRHSRSIRAMRPSGNGSWFSLGPPGGDVFDAAVSTADPGIVLAGIAPDGSSGGTLYRSSDDGDIWSEVLALQGTSVFDIEFAPSGTAYIGT